MRLEDLALIGNCQYSALISSTGDVVWCCFPRFDSDPLFGALLDPAGGVFSVCPPGRPAGVQRYLPNTNVLETRFATPDGSFRVIDLAPRFLQHDRSFRPTQLHRIIEPLEGTPRACVTCEPRLGWSKSVAPSTYGSNHVRYERFGAPVRLTTDIPLSYLGGQPFALTKRHHLALVWGAPIEEPLEPLAMSFLERTTLYWQRWVKHCSVPPIYQQEVIRSALALKLHCYEDTGAIVAAMTTSIPEAPGSGRTWDYRYCWLRDAYYVLSALQLIGHFEERESFIHYLVNIAANHPSLDLAPLYRVDGRSDLDESVVTSWSGYDGDGPVRIGNGAARHVQHDVYGELILAIAPVYADERFTGERSDQMLDLLCRLAHRAAKVAGQPDAGIWEVREGWQAQTFSSLMCWAATDRVARITKVYKPDLTAALRGAADRIHAEILRRAWNPAIDSFVASYDGSDLDASLLQLGTLRFLPMTDRRIVSTVAAVRRGLSVQGWLQRYKADPMGGTTVAFTMCTFWLVEALARLGDTNGARALLDAARVAMSPIGLLSEDYDPVTRRLCGNFPQAYSHVGLIHAAFAAAPGWADVT